jgi:polyketide synthase PksL
MEFFMLNRKFKSQNIVAKLQAKSECQSAIIFLAGGRQETTRITYAGLDHRARVIASYLQSKNLYGERILLLYPAGIDFIVAFIACLYAGVVAVPVHCPETPDCGSLQDRLRVIAENANIAGILTTTNEMEAAIHFYAELDNKQTIFITDTTQVDLGTATAYQPIIIREDAIAYLQYTSGSTSTPKAVVIRHKNLSHNLRYTGKVWHYSKKSVNCSWAHPADVFGLTVGILVPLYYGSTIIIFPPDIFFKDPLAWLQTITKYQVTHSGCPNFAYDICTQRIEADDLSGLQLKTWKVAINCGENTQHETLINFSKKFSACGFNVKQFVSAYIMSEATGIVAVSHYRKAPTFFNLNMEGLKNNEVILAHKDIPHRKFVGNGHLLPGLEAVVVDIETMRPLAEGRVGEIWLTGESIVTEYWQRDQQTQYAFGATVAGMKEIFLRTGDVGFIKNKEICLTGRLEEIFVVNHKKYYSLDLETTVGVALRSFPVTNFRAAFSVSVDGKEELIFAQEIKSIQDDSILEEIIRNIRRTIALRYGIELYDVILVRENSIPKTPSGKLQRKLCQQYYLKNFFPIVKQFLNTDNSLFEILDLDKDYWPACVEDYELEGMKIDSPLRTLQFEFLFSVEDLIKVKNTDNMLHPRFYLKMLAFVVAEREDIPTIFIQHLTFSAPAFIPDRGHLKMQLILDKSESGNVCFHFYSHQEEIIDWVRHAEGQLIFSAIA